MYYWENSSWLPSAFAMCGLIGELKFFYFRHIVSICGVSCFSWQSDEDGSDEDLNSPQGKKRKKIHKIFGDKKLSKETLDAAKAEEERRQRIAERQKLVILC